MIYFGMGPPWDKERPTIEFEDDFVGYIQFLIAR